MSRMPTIIVWLYLMSADRVHPDPSGFIPVGWYPTGVKVIGKKVFVINGKGFSSFPNPGYRAFDTTTNNPSFQKSAVKNEYIGGLFTGTLSIFESPSTGTTGESL